MNKITIDKYFETIEDYMHHNKLHKMNPHEFQNSFKKWIASVAKQTKGQVVPIDGKALRC